ncbi:uncharacterized protein [Zea mays]|uniref:uncharacterized protein n=1 Tax=Zea mays TaxID=4577 RepID=UPI0002208553|nr:uncharacterized protein LOC100501199 [Zea mays]|eukprot:XP_020404909.1 uncharacterized protein LOC100501199 [Zea mays]
MQLNPRQTASQAAKRIVRRRRSARMTIQSCRLHVQLGPARPRCEARSLLGVVRAARSASLRAASSSVWASAAATSFASRASSPGGSGKRSARRGISSRIWACGAASRDGIWRAGGGDRPWAV